MIKLQNIKSSSFSNEQTKSILQFMTYIEKSRVDIERAQEIINGYLYNTLIEVSVNNTFNEKDSPILICVVKNEKVRMEKLFQHYRNLGIFQFAIIDNNSTDGTLELCKKQKDVNLFSVKNEYSSAKRVGWINQILSKYGRNRWYLVVDADELIDYVDSERYTLNDMIQILKKKNIMRALGLQVDFYSKGSLFTMGSDSIDWEKCVYFDTDTYIEQENEKCKWYVGGIRKRVLNTYSLLTKYPLFFLDQETVNVSSHYLYPFKNNFISECILCIKHYEFLNETDFEKIKNIVHKENYADKSREYKEMYERLKLGNTFNFYDCQVSARYENSHDILKINHMRDWK